MNTPAQTDIDATDLAIIAVLKHDARATFGEIGRAVGLSAPAAKRRLDRLEQRGVVLGYTVVVDSAQLGRPLEAFTEVRFSGDARVDQIADIANDIPEVEAVFTVAGDPDALVWTRVADVHDLKRVVDKIRSSGHVVGTKTMMVLGTSTRHR
ncbi:MAG: Lrp/AsnC family transcriptional regulator [Actinomycetota bacterium]